MTTTCPGCHRQWTEAPDPIRLPGKRERYICADCALHLRRPVLARLSARDYNTVIARAWNPIVERARFLARRRRA